MAYIQERKTDDGRVHYRVQVRLKGWPTQTATFERKTDAKRWAQQTEAAIREGRHFKTTEAKKHTVGDLIDRYVREVLPTKPKSLRKQGLQLAWWKQELGAYALADVTPALIVEKRDLLANGTTARGKQRGPATVVRYLAVLSHTFSVATREWGWIEANPLTRVRRPKEPRGRVRFLSDDERVRLLTECKASGDPLLYPVVVLALSTGMRHGEIINLKWDDLHLHSSRIVLHETKNGERRVVALAGHALDVMREHAKIRRLDTALVFPAHIEQKEQKPQKPASLRTAWCAAVQRASLQDFRFHDLRHSAASYLAMNGATPGEIAEVLGHKTLQMVKRYAHLSEQHTARVVASMNEKIFGGGL